MNFRKLLTYLTVGTAAVIPFASAQNPTILQGNYVSNVFGQSNFVLNPNAQTNVANVTVSSATVTRSTTTPLVAKSEFNVAITSANGTATWATRAFDAGMKGQNCEARFSYRGFAATSIVQIKQSTNVVASLTLTPATDPRIASINFPCGDLSTATTFVVTDTAILAGTNEISGIYTGLATNMANVAQAEFVGSLRNFNPSGGTCIWFGNNATAIAADADCSTYQKTGLNLEPSTKVPAISFTAPRSGTYQIAVHAYIGAQVVQSAECQIYQNNTMIQNLSHNYTAAGVTSNENRAFVQFASELTSGTAYTFDIRCNTSNVILARYFEESLYWTVYRFPTSSELVVTPERQNTFAGIKAYSSGDSNNVTTGTTKLTAAGTLTRETFGKALVESNNDYSITIKNMPVGSYQVTAQGWLFAVSASSGVQTQCVFTISDNATAGTTIGGFVSNIYGDATAPVQQSSSSVITGVYYNSSVADRTFYVRAAKSLGNACKGYTDQPSTPLIMTVTPLDQPSNSALYVEGPVKSAATGAVVAPGYIGEIITSASATTGTIPAGVTLGQNVATLTLTPGTWLVSAGIEFGGGTTANLNMLSISTISGSIYLQGTSQTQPAVGGSFGSFAYLTRIIRVTTNTPVYSVIRTWYPSGTSAYSNQEMQAIRVGSN
jgi:hypothetical protein